MRSPGALSHEGKRGGLTDAEDSATDWLGQQRRPREHEGPEAASVILRPCLDCGRLIPKGTSRCATCIKPNPYGSEHQRRSRLLRALHPWCEECGATEDLTADHIVPLARGGDPLGKLRVLCRSCNSRRGGNAAETRSHVLWRESEGTRRMPVRREGEGASVGDPGWELVAAGRGRAHPLRREGASSVAPRLASRLLRLTPQREAGVRGSWMLPSANADAPTSLSRVTPRRAQRHRGKH